MSHPDAGDARTIMGERPDDETVDRMQTMLDETRLRLLQQLLASDDGALSVEELSYRNTDLKDRTIDYHLRELEKRGVVERLKADPARNDLPNTYWAVTGDGIESLQQLGFYDEIAVLSEADDALERTDRIREIEAFEGRPRPDWD